MFSIAKAPQRDHQGGTAMKHPVMATVVVAAVVAIVFPLGNGSSGNVLGLGA